MIHTFKFGGATSVLEILKKIGVACPIKEYRTSSKYP
jgi:hypothetical protein